MENTTYSIKEWAVEDRPREKLLYNGKNILSDAELIAILIGSGNRDESAVELSRKILRNVNNNLNELGKLSIKDLMKFKGIGEAKAISIISALELGRRMRVSEKIEKPQILSSKDAYNQLFISLEACQVEEFWVLLLNRANKMVSKQKVGLGGVTGTVVDVRVIFKLAIENLATSIILCHNHPSGNLMPSNADIDITNKIKEAGKTLDVNVIDHLIISDSGYYSFADEGKL